MHLCQTTKEVLEKMRQAEENQDFHHHIDSNPCEDYIAVDEKYSYVYTWYKRVGYYFLNLLIVKPYRFYANHMWFQTRVVGKNNLNSIPGGAILTCNHINKLDSLVVGHALKDKKIRYTAAEFNNFDTPLGSLMRAYGMLSIPSKGCYLKKFQEEVERVLSKKEWILFFPEEAEWWCYEKPRPYLMGAFHFAAKYNVPILPLFITFIKTNKLDSQSLEKRKFVLHILRPIYPKMGVSIKENKTYMKNLNEKMVWDCYQRFYKN